MQEYRVQLDAFEGPLDLLMFLIKRAEVDLHDIPVAPITRQYLRFLSEIDRVDIETAGEFLVMASTLMEVKSRLIEQEADRAERRRELERAARGRREAPRDDPDSGLGGPTDQAEPDREPEEDPRLGLVRRLLEYKQFRDAAAGLERRMRAWDLRSPSASAHFDQELVREALGEPDSADLDVLSTSDLARAYANVAEAVNFERLGEHAVVDDDTPIELHQADILDRLTRAGESRTDGDKPNPETEDPSLGLTLAQIMQGRSRLAMIGMFIATLELIRQRKVHVSLDGRLDAENEPAGSTLASIRLRLREPDETPPPTGDGSREGSDQLADGSDPGSAQGSHPGLITPGPE